MNTKKISPACDAHILQLVSLTAISGVPNTLFEYSYTECDLWKHGCQQFL